MAEKRSSLVSPVKTDRISPSSCYRRATKSTEWCGESRSKILIGQGGGLTQVSGIGSVNQTLVAAIKGIERRMGAK